MQAMLFITQDMFDHMLRCMQNDAGDLPLDHQASELRSILQCNGVSLGEPRQMNLGELDKLEKRLRERIISMREARDYIRQDLYGN